MKPIAEIPARSSRDVRAGTLRGPELRAYGAILAEHGGGVLLVTGAGEGRLAVSTGLAAAAVARGTRVALLECDLFSPALAGVLGLAAGPGLGEYLDERAEAPEILQSLVLAGPASGAATAPLVCIVGGESGDDREPGLRSPHFRHAVEKLRHAYELVVLHGPPLGDPGGGLPVAADGADLVLACVGPELASGRSGRKLAKVLRRLPARGVAVVVYGAAAVEPQI